MQTNLRRLSKKVKGWRELLAANPECFKAEWWGRRVGAWVAEAGCIARQYTGVGDLDPELRRKRVFEVVDRAQLFLLACGPEVTRAVGQRTISYLRDECSRVVANAMAPHLRNLTINHARFRPRIRGEKLGPRGAP